MPASANCLAAAVVLGLAHAAWARSYTYSILDRRDSSIAAINDKGDILVNNAVHQFQYNKCFLVQGATRVRIADPENARASNCTGVSRKDTVTGYATDPSSFQTIGFTYAGGTYTETDTPVLGAQPLGISSDGRNIAGTFYPQEPIGYVIIGARSQIFQAPDALLTWAVSINDSGIAAVYSLDRNYASHSYVLKHRKLTEFQFPGALFTRVTGINDALVATGTYYGADEQAHGFVYDTVSGAAQTVDVPNAADTQWMGINNAGTLVGTCVPDSDGKYLHGVQATLK